MAQFGSEIGNRTGTIFLSVPFNITQTIRIPRRGIYVNLKTSVDKAQKGKGRIANALSHFP